MISHLALKNFKSLKEADLDLRKLNILVGPNNTGKSSVLHALAFLAQNSEEPKLHLNERYVNLGKLRDVSFKGEDIVITFRIKFDEDEGKRTTFLGNKDWKPNITQPYRAECNGMQRCGQGGQPH